jgi:cell division protein FtsI (penicillin-binding protein 3)
MASPPRFVSGRVARNRPPRQGARASRSLSWLSRSLESLPQVQLKPSKNRLLTVWLILVGATIFLILNLFRLQIQQGASLSQQAQEQQMQMLRPFVPRRSIVDRTGNVLAIDRPVFSLFAHPKLFKEPKAAVAEKLALVLNRPAADLLKKLDQAESGVRVEYAISEDMGDRVDRLNIDGLERIQSQQRLYPQGELMGDIVGYVNDEHAGQAGLELSQQKLLERSVKAGRMRRMGDGSVMPDQVPGGFLSVDDLHLKLTLDAQVQRSAQAALQKQMKVFNAKRGTVIVMDARDGSLLVLAEEPSYDPNQYYKFPIERYKNWALADLYEPGSTFKPINVAIALEAKAIKPTDVFDDPGEITVSGWPINNAGGSGHGAISITEIVKYSSNVGMVRIVQQMKSSLYYDWLIKLGLGKPVGIDLPAEVAGQFKSRKTFIESSIEPAVTAFGQGFSLTPIQLTQLHAALANGGKLVIPHVVKGLYDTKGQPYWEPNLSQSKQVFTKETTQAVLPMMETVVKDGTGKPAQIAGYRVGGKTGTAQKASQRGGYSDHALITSFVGILPIEAPRYVVLAVVDEPQGIVSGAAVAAPIVKSVMETLITSEKIPPSNPEAVGKTKPTGE